MHSHFTQSYTKIRNQLCLNLVLHCNNSRLNMNSKLEVIAILLLHVIHAKSMQSTNFYQVMDHDTYFAEEPQRTTGNLKFVYSKVEPWIQAAAANEVIQRLLPGRAKEFEILVDPALSGNRYMDAFQISINPHTKKVQICGTTGVAAVFGFHDYLKYHCNCHVSWEGSQLQLPDKLPHVSYFKEIIDRFRYYQNVCTESYSFVWWDWERWEKEIDWMALQGINTPLVTTGQEKIWQKVYLDLGLSYEDIADYITGPAFLAWWRMGNIQRWGGPIPQSYIDSKLHLFRKITRRMTNLGMLPVLPAFAGSVPFAIRKIYPNISLIENSSWNKFNKSYSTFLLPPSDPLFKEIGSKFLNEIIKEAGGTISHIYTCDTFNENDPSDNSTEFLRDSAKFTYRAMKEADDKAVWLLQSWVFQSKFWNPEQVEAYLSGVERGNAIVLDLEAERRPLYEKFNNFYGHSFIWCMLQNYGGTNNLYGALGLVEEGIIRVRRLANSSSSIIGIGSCPEGINQNSVVFDFMYEKSLASKNDNSSRSQSSQWVHLYARRRYGIQNRFIESAWDILQSSVYNAPANIDNHGRSILIRRPNLRLEQKSWYKLEDIIEVVDGFIQALTKTPEHLYNSLLYKHDLVDFTRQFLERVFARIYKYLSQGYGTKDVEIFSTASTHLLEVLDDLEGLLATNEHFLLGKWVKNAESFGTSDEEKRLLRYNSLNQISLWGPTGEIVDYAAKQWAGTIADYYKPRWARFITALNSSLVSGKPFQSKRFRKSVLLHVERPFTFSTKLFPTSATGNSVEEAIRIYSKWAEILRELRLIN